MHLLVQVNDDLLPAQLRDDPDALARAVSQLTFSGDGFEPVRIAPAAVLVCRMVPAVSKEQADAEAEQLAALAAATRDASSPEAPKDLSGPEHNGCRLEVIDENPDATAEDFDNMAESIVELGRSPESIETAPAPACDDDAIETAAATMATEADEHLEENAG